MPNGKATSGGNGSAASSLQDYWARGEATRAHQRITDHEIHCAERWNRTRKDIEDLTRQIDGLRSQLRSQFVWTVGIFLAAQAFVITVLLAYGQNLVGK